MRKILACLVVGGWGLLALPSCGNDHPRQDLEKVRVTALHEEAAFTSVHGSAQDDVWVVGADDGQGPVALHFDGSDWTRKETGVIGDLWWVQALSDGTAYFAGAESHILFYEDGEFERLSAPGLGKHIVFGLWASGPKDLYAVGAIAGRNGFIWHYDGEKFQELPIPDELARDDGDVPPLFKVEGADKNDVWIVGGDGAVLRGNKKDGFHVVESHTKERLFTVSVGTDRVVIVGGSRDGILLEAELDSSEPKLIDRTPSDAPLLQGVDIDRNGRVWVVGRDGAIYQRDGDAYKAVYADLPQEVVSLHAAWVDPSGQLWTVGGDVLSAQLDHGVAFATKDLPRWEYEPEPIVTDNLCPADKVDLFPDKSMARRFNEQLLNAIRRDVPRPTVHARNLYHVSLAMWDAWAAYDDAASGVVIDEKLDADDIEQAREEAIAYASYRILSHRYAGAVGGEVSLDCFGALMDTLGFDPEDDTTKGDSPRALGNRIGKAVIERFADDGANEDDDYADPQDYRPDNPILIVDEAGTIVDDPTQWQQLLLAESVTQNGISEGAGLRQYVGAHWGQVTPFALERSKDDEPYFSGENPPTQLDDALVQAAVQVLQKTKELDIDDGVMMDVSPRSYGNNSLGKDDGHGRDENPYTGKPYEKETVLRGDFTRILAEFWADGPTSETPPGHWNTLANLVADHPDGTHRLFGEGSALDELAWDVHVYLALNGALHDAAIAAWELKRHFTSARPITLIRYLAGLGQRSDENAPSYHPDGIVLVPGLIEVITEESSADGERHQHLRRYRDEIAVYSWRGEPGDRDTEIGGFDWIRAADWIPYQRRTFVTPAFPGYISGHSTFSRAGAEVLTLLTGDSYFPGGLGKYRLKPGYLVFEYGPTATVELQWATYFDASDQAGQSRLWGGIHIVHDDHDGRKIGSQVGQLAVEHARTFFALTP